MAFDHQQFIDQADDWIVNRTKVVILGFLVLTVLFGIGLGNIETQAGTEQFAEEVPAEEALQRINEEFGPSFAASEGSTQLIQSEQNVLSKPALLRMLRAQERLEETDGLRVTSTASAARIVARTIDPEAATLSAQIRVVETATPAEIDQAVRTAAVENQRFPGLLSTDFNRQAASASATVGVVTHSLPAELAQGAGTGGASPLTSIQLRSERIVNSVGGDIRVFGTGIFSSEFSNVIGDTMIVVIPAAVILIVLFLVVAYRDLVDLLIGVFALIMTIVWTFGFMGLAGIAFNQILIAVPPLLLAVGIDFGIHAVNRYREERVQGFDIDTSVATMTDQIVVAFFIVTATTVIGFLSNVTSALVPIRDFGIVASIGIVFTFLIFGVFLPALKVYVDRQRERFPIPTFSQSPLGAEGSRLGKVLTGGVVIARRAPAIFLVGVILVSGVSAFYATGIDTSFSQEDFLPAEETPPYLEALPEPFKPSDYTVVGSLNFLEDNFESSQDATVTVYVQGPMERDSSLEMINRVGLNPPDSVLREQGFAESQSIVSVIRSEAATNDEFRRLVERNDRNDNGIPDDNLGEVYDALLASPARDSALGYLTEDRRSTQIVYSVEADAEQAAVTADGRILADRYRFEGTATGTMVVFQAISDLILQSALTSLMFALVGTVIFLVFIYWLLEGRPLLGVANTVPIVVTVALIAGAMRLAGLSFNAFTATVLAITIGLGIDYSAHATHRFADEFDKLTAETGSLGSKTQTEQVIPALVRAVQGTGGALTGSMLTTVFGIGVLVLAIFPAIGNFGLITALSVLFSYLASLLVLPSVLVLWARWDRRASGRKRR